MRWKFLFNIAQKIYLKIKIKRSTPVKRGELLKKSILKDSEIGSNFQVHRNVNFGSEPYLLKFGNDVRITSGVIFATHDGGMWVLRNNNMAKDADLFGNIEVGNNVHIGVNAIIMPNVKIGDNVVIGAGSIVTKDVSSNSVMAGIPAKKLSTIEAYYEKNKNRIEKTKHLNSDEKKKYLINKYKKGIDFN